MAGKQMQLEDWLDDLCVRFIINLPEEDLSSVARICFQVEEAQWFYEDFIRPLDASLPSMTLRTFCLRIFQHCPLLASFSVENHTKAFEEFLEYKTRVPVRGAILLNQEMDSAVLVKAWKKGASWSFPRGKINKDEDDLDCAVREVWEETGLDLRTAGLVPTEAKPKYIEIPIKQQQLRLYIFRNVPMDTNFQPQTRKEISKIQWYKLSELPSFRKKGGQNQHEEAAGPQANKFYMVAPFLVPLKKWVTQQKKLDEKKAAAAAGRQAHLHPYMSVEEVVTEDDTWNQSDMPAPYHVPAIETLDGATQELQRLLKMQPPTQGLQPATAQEDKGSALLSILQSKSGGMAAPAQPAAHLPHTPMAHNAGGTPQPRNPHHHTNQHGVPLNMHEAPPSFTLPQNQQAASWNHQQGQAHAHQLPPQAYMAMAEQRYSNQAPLVHPQPLPPQVQRAMFNSSVFQENAQVQYADGARRQSTYGGVENQFPQQLQQAMPQAVPQQHAPVPQAGAGPIHLTGQSMDLLSAFKRDVAPANPAQLPENYPPSQARYSGQGHRASSYGTAHQPVVHQKSPTELAGTAVAPPADQHRSALLGMFKKASMGSPDTPIQGLHRGSIDATGHLSPQSPVEKESLPQFPGQVPISAPMLPVSRNPSQGHIDPVSGLSFEQLSIQSGPAQPNMMASAGAGQIPGVYQGHHAAQSHPQAPRILQRGQDPRAYGLGEQASVSPKTLVQGFQNHPRAGRPVVSPPTASGAPSPTAHQRRPDASNDQQKRQLLSLFGKQQRPGSALAHEHIPHEAAEAPRSRVASMASNSASSRLGRQTPISPADQSFLLGYLQSVTNNAAR
ncbi:Dcp2, box A domain-containing protein [Stachybotrys elegans]|uniref:Dcp2, box A domain-containing protein n=1 Tax=Stachybotrys elegans TaxID=80388 RepID=A0A8K0SN67_9HYPO|nr:Dcp2, box A domain-containing protein [Stachybotrys elegans]